MTETLVEKVVAVVKKAGGKIEFPRPITNPEHKFVEDVMLDAKARNILVKEHRIVCNRHENKYFFHVINANSGTRSEATADSPVTSETRINHTYIPPPFYEAVKNILRDIVPHNIWFSGPTGCGKTEFVHFLANDFGMEQYKKPIPVFQVNGRHDMESSGFLGDKTIEIDKETKQNHIVFKSGPVVHAMLQGLNEKGEVNPKEPPGILFIDETPSLPSHIMIALNRLLETRNKERRITLDIDGGREIKSHPGFRIICAGNTIGRGLLNHNDALYTAQADALDISTLNRFSATFKFGYNKAAEKSILVEKVGDSRLVSMVLKFRDGIRLQIREGKLITPFSTRDIVAIADLYRVMGAMDKAIYYSVMNRLPSDERKVYNEIAHAVFGIDVLKNMEHISDFDYMD